MGVKRRFANVFSRSAERVANNLGIIPMEETSAYIKTKRVRDEKLETFDEYYEGRQYNHLKPWDSQNAVGEYVPIRQRKPRVNYNFAKKLANTISSKLLGHSTFPSLKIEDDPETEYLMTLLLKGSKIKHVLLDAMKLLSISGSVFVRYYIVNGVLKMETHKSKYCYPEFDEVGELNSITIRYPYFSPGEVNELGKPIERWYQLTLGEEEDILFDSPEVEPGTDPVFQETERQFHGMGFVQGEWFRTSEDRHSPDGYSLIGDILEFIDEINYSLSQSNQATAYAQEPQLAVNGMDTEEVDNLIKSAQKAWNLGRDGNARFVESNLGGVEVAQHIRDRMKQGIVDIARVVMLDPEKIVGTAQSAKAMEVLHGPLVDLINELRPVVEDRIVRLVTKLLVTVVMLNSMGLPAPVTIAPGWTPTSVNITLNWPPIFPLTMADLREKAQVGVMLSNASILSRESITRWLSKDFGIENWEEEVEKVKAQPVINPFGAF